MKRTASAREFVTKRIALDVFLVVGSLCRSAHPHSTPSSQAEADTLFEQGKVALREGDWGTACDRFKRSFDLDASASALVKIARCHEHEGHVAQALTDYARATQLIQSLPEQTRHTRDLESLIQKAVKELEPMVGKVQVTLSPPASEAKVLIDDAPVAPGAPLVSVDPGAHTISAEVPGYRAEPAFVNLGAGQSLEVKLVLVPVPAAPADAVAAPPAASAPFADAAPIAPPPITGAPSQDLSRVHPDATQSTTDRTSTGQSQRIIAYMLGGTGVALGALAGYFALSARSHLLDAQSDNHCNADYRCDRQGFDLVDAARRDQTRGIVAVASGGLLVGTAVVLFATAPKNETANSTTRKSVGLGLSPFGVSVGGAW